MKVSHFMTGYAPTCRDDSSIAEVEKLVSVESGPISVIDCDGRLVGVLRLSDIREATSRFSRVAAHIRAHEAMCKETGACRETDDVDVALSRMKSSGLDRLPVVDASGRLIGAVFVVDPQVSQNEEFLAEALGRTGVKPEPTVVSHRSPSYIDGSVRPSK